jgi:type II secretory pathway predicted ATPase ExeA
MYTGYFGLQERPFELTPNPDYLLLTEGHREALAMLQYGMSSRKGLVVLTGEAGTGKTTLLRTLHADAGDASRFVTITNPRLSREEFIETVAEGFGLSREAAGSKPRMLDELRELLLKRLEQDRWSALVVDEAHALGDELLEEVRLLANLETDSTKLMSIVLAGQPELAGRLNEARQWHLKQRVALRCVLNPLTREETFAFVASRIRKAGGQASGMFTRDAVDLCYQCSRGIPRLISVICDNALIAAYAAGEKPVNVARIREVCGQLDLAAEVPQAAAHRPTESPKKPPLVTNVRAAADDHLPEQAVAEPPALFGRFWEPRRAWFVR